MITGGSYEAKTHLPSLLEQVAQGEQVTITRHGVPVARLVPISSSERKPPPVRETIAAIQKFSQGNRLRGLSIRKLISEGRR